MTTHIDSQDGNRPIPAPRVRNTLDIATVIGLLAAFALIAAAIVLGGSPSAFMDVPAVCIVIGGTFGIVTACFSMRDVWMTLKAVRTAVFSATRHPKYTAMQLLRLSQFARQHGTLALQQQEGSTANNDLLHQGLTMVIDGTSGDDIERIMTREVQAAMQRHTRSIGVLRKAAEISPAMGLIGTLVGLVQMLGNLDDPSSIGPAMAVALLTTLYGAILSNMVFTPLASKLERNAAEDMIVNHLCVLAAASIGRQENPRHLEMLLNTVLPPAQRVDYFS